MSCFRWFVETKLLLEEVPKRKNKTEKQKVSPVWLGNLMPFWFYEWHSKKISKSLIINEYHGLIEYCRWLCATIYSSTSSMIIHRDTKQTSSRAVFMNIQWVLQRPSQLQGLNVELQHESTPASTWTRISKEYVQHHVEAMPLSTEAALRAKRVLVFLKKMLSGSTSQYV